MLLHPLTAVVLGAWMLRKRSVASRMRRQQESSLSIRARAVSAGLPIRADNAHFEWVPPGAGKTEFPGFGFSGNATTAPCGHEDGPPQENCASEDQENGDWV